MFRGQLRTGSIPAALSSYLASCSAHGPAGLARRSLSGLGSALSGFVGGHFPAAKGPPVLVTRPSVGPAPPASPPSPGISGGTGP